MSFQLGRYEAPDFTEAKFVNASEAKLARAPRDKAAPEGFHAMSIFPEYFKVNGKWVLPKDSRMDCVPVLEENGEIRVCEFRNLKEGDRGSLAAKGIVTNVQDFVRNLSKNLR